MAELLVREVSRRNPFRSVHVPWAARVYARPIERWPSLARQALFGAPYFLLFYLIQRVRVMRATGVFSYTRGDDCRKICYDALNTQFSAIYLKSFSFGYEPHIAAAADLLCADDAVCYDIGSNWGWLSLYVASRTSFTGQIHAFEPYPRSFRDLQSVVSQAGLASRIHCHNLALSDEAGEVRMRLPDKFQSGQAQIERAVPGRGESSCVTLDSLGLPPPAFIKLDVEGAEAKVLGGARETLEKHQPMIIFESGRRDDCPLQTLQPLIILKALGYRFYHLCWLRTADGVKHLVGDDCDTNPNPNEILALSEFQLEERFLRSHGMNILACHASRLGELGKKFSGRMTV